MKKVIFSLILVAVCLASTALTKEPPAMKPGTSIGNILSEDGTLLSHTKLTAVCVCTSWLQVTGVPNDEGFRRECANFPGTGQWCKEYKACAYCPVEPSGGCCR